MYLNKQHSAHPTFYIALDCKINIIILHYSNKNLGECLLWGGIKVDFIFFT